MEETKAATKGQSASVRQPAKGKDRELQSQSERFIAKARELGLDEMEETFDAALGKVARHKGSKQSAVISEESFIEGRDNLGSKPDSEKPSIKHN